MDQEFIDALKEQPKVTFIESLFTAMMVTAGKGLSQEDFTTALMNKLTTIEGSHFKGVHITLAALEIAFPAATAEAGSYAYIKDGTTPETLAMLDDAGDVWIEQTQSVATPLTGVQIKALYEGNADTEVFDTAAKALLASALQTHQDITGKVDIVAGKDLSQEDFTTILKDKLATLEGSHFKGTHADEAALIAAHPTAEAGSYAYVLVHNAEHHFIWDGAAWLDTGAAGPVHLTDAQIKAQYEANADTNAFDDAYMKKVDDAEKVFAGVHTDLTVLETAFPAGLAKAGSYAYLNNGTDPQSFAMISNGSWVEIKSNLPDAPATDGEYVLTVVGGVSTWGLNSGGALIYDAYILGSSVNADVALSIYHKFDGVAEETRNAAIDLTDGQEYLVQPMYQSGLTDAHILDSVNMFASKSFADQTQATPAPNQLYGDSGNPILGQAMKAWVNAGATIAIKYDSVFGGLKATIRP